LFSKTYLSDSKKIKYYSNSSNNKIINRYFANEYFDTARFINYINLIIKKNCSIKTKLNHLDIGGGFGFFSKVLKKKFPKINSFNLEPDKSAALIAKKLNREINIINLPFEKVNLIKKTNFDLITYWGGIYRTIEPSKVFRDLKKICTKNCNFFFSFPFSFDDMKMQHLELKNSFDDYLLTGDGLKGFFGRKHMSIFLKKNNFSFKEIYFQNRPFKKKIPIFIFKQNREYKNKKLKKINLKNYFKKNISAYNNFFIDQIKNVINSQNKINKIFIFGDNFLSKYAFNYLKKNNKFKVINIENNSENLFKDKQMLKTILNLNNLNSNVFLIFESQNENKIKNSLKNRLHLDTKNNLYNITNDFNFENDVFSFEKSGYLKKKINLVKA